MSSRAGEFAKKDLVRCSKLDMGLKNVPKKFGTPFLGYLARASCTVCNKLNPKRLGAKFGPGVPNFLGTFFRPICQVSSTQMSHLLI